jgi:hypothetical protein
VVDPAAPLPPLNTESGREFATFRLAAAFGARFVNSKTGNIKCKRLARSRVGCEVFWIYGRNVYGAEVKVFYLRAHDAVVWDSHFRARWGRLACLEDEGRRRPCPLQSKRG